MIDERGLLSAMKSTWRSEGYTVAGYREDGELVWIGVGDPRAYGDMLVWDDEGGLGVVLPGREIIGEELAAVLEQTPLV